DRAPVARPDHRRRTGVVGRLPPVPLGSGHHDHRAGPVPQPPGRLDPRRPRPPNSPVSHSPGEMQDPRKGWAMRFKSPLIAISAVGMLALSACGGSGSDSTDSGTGPDNSQLGATGNGQDPTAKGPVTIDGAT